MQGTFGWDINFPSGVTSATLTVRDIDNFNTVLHSLDFVDVPAGYVQLNVGSYNVYFRLLTDNGYVAILRRVLRIFDYQNITSHFPMGGGTYIYPSPFPPPAYGNLGRLHKPYR